MTSPVDDPAALRRILANTEALLLDFDGPVCRVFAGIPAPVVADQLRAVLAEGGHADLPEDVQSATDPFDVLFYAAKLGQDEARYVEAAFRAHEVEAVQSAEPTPGAGDLIRAWRATGRKLTIVSNNGVAAVRTYLDLYDLSGSIDIISARSTADVSLLKPNPHLVSEAARMLEVGPEACTLVGDSLTDIEAAHAAGVNAIAYANKPGKAERFSLLEPAVVITSQAFTGLAQLVQSLPSR